MTLFFVGMGLHDHLDLTFKGVEIARRCDKVYVELYTSLMAGLNLRNLEEILGRKVHVLSRGDLEGAKAQEILREAMEDDVALLVPGDPFIATTHIALKIEAKKLGVEVKTVHAASIASAIPGLTGLSFYKFGRKATVVYPEPNYRPEAAYDVVKENLLRGLHTMLLLDVKAEQGLYMTVPEALRILLDVEEKRREGVLSPEALAVGVSRAGSLNPEVKACSIERLLSLDLGPPPHTLVIPGDLHFMEEEALMYLCGATKDEVEVHKRRLKLLREVRAL